MSEISREELDEIYAFAIELGKQAGKMLMEAANRRMAGGNENTEGAHVEKDNAVDLVTQTDLDVEQFVKSEIFRKYPEHKLVSHYAAPFRFDLC